MNDLQHELFSWIIDQPALTGAVVMAAGLIYGFHGFRLFRFLLGVSSAILGWWVGAVIGTGAGIPLHIAGFAGAFAVSALSFTYPRPAVATNTTVFWALMGFYFAERCGLFEEACFLTGAVAALLGLLFSLICYRTVAVILTTLQGAVLIVTGFLGFSYHMLPAIGVTFRQWAESTGFFIPVILGMIVITGYSYQSMRQQGDIRTGK